jgi:DNA mismatch repair protein MutL
LENALDASARVVTIEVEQAGKHLIEVADDGDGIAASDLALSVARHATSKLATADDLFHITTLGFRGEALASIGSVSRMTISTRLTDAAEGARLRIEGGREAPVETIGAPAGTVVRVEDLFYNVPARLKFLKSDPTERRAIDALITRYALAYPHVRIQLRQDGSTMLQTAGDGDRRAILAAIYGVEIGRQLLEITAEDQGLRLEGYVSPIAVTRSNRREITIFVNGRWVHDTPLTTAILKAYHNMLMVGRFPIGALFLTLDPEEVDVNVHPAKAEVRFRNQDRVFGFIQRAVRRGMLAYTPVPDVAPRLWGAGATQLDPAWEFAHPDRAEPPPASSPTATPIAASLRLPLLRLVGQIGTAYIVAEGPDGLYLIDQHAAHERVLYEKLLQQHARKAIAAQRLLAPVTVTVPPHAGSVLKPQLPVLKQLGFDVEEFGPNSFQIRAMPALFAGRDAAAALRAVVEDFEEDESPLQQEIENRLAARVCKRMAIKAGQSLSTEEQRALVSDLEACEAPRTCPHGRPTMIHLSVDSLERQFGRRGPR